MSLEIENKYVIPTGREGNIIKWIHKQDEISHYLIEQFYVVGGDRYRMVTDGITENRTFFHTVKSPTDVPGVFREDETEISFKEYEANHAFRSGKSILKRRYVFPAESFSFWQRIKSLVGKGPKQRSWEVDVYLDLDLITAEVEHSDVSLLGQILPPHYVNAIDVTGQKQWSNRQLSIHGVPATGPIGTKGIDC